MERVTKQDLERAVQLLNDVTCEDYSLGWAYGGVRVERANESVSVTRRGTKREVYAMLLGMLHVAELLTITNGIETDEGGARHPDLPRRQS
tara:strand:- start:473 stop:745 length:273 start_codon:yes stop_codon:yes gene_type:complete